MKSLPPPSVLALLAGLAWLWWQLIDQLRVEWSVNPQYAYGWAVPILCLILLWRNVARGTPAEPPPPGRHPAPPANFRWQLGLAVVAALLYLPTRLLQEANPDWRLVSWALALEVITLTLCTVTLVGHPRSGPRAPAFNLSAFVFPVGFFLVAVPWPTVIEAPFIQGLTRLNAAVTIELLNTFGIPALQRGNVIEISTGLVGIDDACSGIRSFQATLMLSLFLGAFYRLPGGRRVALVLSGFALALLFNLGRTLLLVTVAARQGVPAIQHWHDPAGVTILVGCFGGLWLTALALHPPSSDRVAAPSSGFSFPLSAFNFPRPLAYALAAWLVVTELGTEFWYRSHEQQLARAVDWQLAPPAGDPTLRELPLSEAARRILRYDAARNVAWTEPTGARWQMIFLRWNGGRVAVHLARNHTPEVCLTAAGHQLQSVSDVQRFTVHGVTLPFRLYTFQNDATPLFVFYCLREDRAREETFATENLTYDNRFAAVAAGRRNLGQRSLEVALWGQPDAATATAALQRELERVLQVSPAPTP